MSVDRNKRALEFITLTTGAASIAQRRDVWADTMAMAAELLRGETPNGWSVVLSASHPTSHVYDVLLDGAEISTCYLCAAEIASDAMWEAAETLAPPQTVLHRPRGTPWLAVAILPGVIDLPRDLTMALPWLELAVAWRLLETRR